MVVVVVCKLDPVEAVRALFAHLVSEQHLALVRDEPEETVRGARDAVRCRSVRQVYLEPFGAFRVGQADIFSEEQL